MTKEIYMDNLLPRFNAAGSYGWRIPLVAQEEQGGIVTGHDFDDDDDDDGGGGGGGWCCCWLVGIKGELVLRADERSLSGGLLRDPIGRRLLLLLPQKRV